MAEAIVSFAIERIANLLAEKTYFLSSVTVKFEQLQRTLERMRCFLKDADSKQDLAYDERIKNFCAEIRDLAYDAEDAIDTFLLKAPRRRDGLRGWVKESTFIITKAHQLHEIGTEIDAIRARLTEIYTDMQTLGIKLIPDREGSSSAGEMQRRLRSDPRVEEEHIVVGLEDIKNDVIAQLKTELDDPFRVVSIVGVGGLGKTTLAKKVYNDVNLQQHFDCCCWAFISQQLSVTDVLLKILMQVGTEQDKGTLEKNMKLLDRRMIEHELVVIIRNRLKEKRFLLVLDDIWKNEAWDCLKQAFPSNGKTGSKVLLTTRNKEVALHADPRSSLVELPFLSDDDGWTLLRKIAFVGEDERSNSPEFIKLGREMVERCGGLPLAVVVLGGMLASKNSLNQWEDVHRNINAQLQHQQRCGGVDWILALSYRELPFHLKPCFLYLSQFLEDYEIHKRDLIRMWIAECFVSEPLTEDMTLEDVGEEYLNELVSRCMVQVYKRDHTGRGVKTFRIHDLMRDMCVLKAKEEGFLQVSDMTNQRESNMNKSRRIALHWNPRVENEGLFLPVLEGNPRCRSLIYFHEKRIETQQIKSICKNHRLLRVLKFNGDVNQGCGFLRGAIGNNLIHLRYLGLRRYHTEEKKQQLQVSLGNMKNLLTLDLREGKFRRIPDVLWKLKCLRHLLLGQ